MPEVSRFYGIVIAMYWADHPLPHFHAEYSGHKASVHIGTGALIARMASAKVTETGATMGVDASHRAPRELAAVPTETASPSDCAAAMTEMAHITRVKPLEPYWVRLWFADGSIHEVDMGAVLERHKGIVDVHSDPTRFAEVRVAGRFGTIEWPGGLDFDPDVLHGDFEPVSGNPYPRRIIRGPRESQNA